jgi:hypothetical protein
MEKIYPILIPMSIKIKKMYTNSEIEIIVKNCNTMAELYAVSACFAFLIQNKYQKRSAFLEVQTHFRFRKLEK